MHVSALFLYPVKSLRGFAVSAARVDALGMVGDRRFLVIDGEGTMLTQRVAPQMARITTELTATDLLLRAQAGAPLAVPLAATDAPLRTVAVWRSHGLLAEDCGPEASDWLSSQLGLKAHLVRIGSAFRRPVLDRPAFAPGGASGSLIEGRLASASDVFHFADGFPFMATTQSSLALLNDRLAESGAAPVPMDRFRPSFVISGSAPFAEDGWSRLRVGELSFRNGGPSARCIVTTTDQLSGERMGAEPLRTLATFRRDPDDSTRINFGQNLVHETKSGTLRVGDPVEVLS
ncbi:MOSC domain-containing protein [Opitutus terrae]|uniref:MOSC domain protein beta barrel domain protein n=1 Tax=Opitutus terrae (strain DSM 11246 / JCM 15787 / PB90-1) TaxID=452637 RepID=B1ZS85_OPITP|nr:MOSC N-terminal beta barrel domain-containing protein [Opitutus terrae]ACB75684.1 MOSC domain protein beta barrel domain protein [Opitutus terrae PB90-1]